jgi:hypothetical protein
MLDPLPGTTGNGEIRSDVRVGVRRRAAADWSAFADWLMKAVCHLRTHAPVRSVDHLVRTSKKRQRNRQAKCHGRPEIDVCRRAWISAATGVCRRGDQPGLFRRKLTAEVSPLHWPRTIEQAKFELVKTGRRWHRPDAHHFSCFTDRRSCRSGALAAGDRVRGVGRSMAFAPPAGAEDLGDGE